MKRILITGASGFIGQSICKSFSKLGRSVCGVVRSFDTLLTNNHIEYLYVEDINLKTNWKNVLVGIDSIIHCAGRAHKMSSNEDFDLYHLENTEGTKNLAEQAAKAGIRRFIFLSSIKVNGESTDKIKNKEVFSYNDIPNPLDAYAKSKLAAEKELWKISSKTNLEIVIVRLPLVYGEGAKGNLAQLIKIIKTGIPLPFSTIKNQRSMIGIDNLVDLLIRCIDCPEASGKTFLVSDGEDLSTPDLIKLITLSYGKKPYLFPFPIFLLKFLGSIFGKEKEISRLVNSLRIDNSYAKNILKWTPPNSVKEGINKMVQGK